MATPTIATVAPAKVWTGGQLVTITGTNFRVPTVPSHAHAGPYPAPVPTVGVTVGGAAARDVRVLSSTALTCVLPARDAGAVAVTVENLDGAGEPIAGEAATLANAVTYARPPLDSTVESPLGRVNREVIRMLRRQVLDNVLEYVSTDYADGTYQEAFFGKLPAIGLSGPDVQASTDYARPSAIETGGHPATTFDRRRPPDAVDLAYELVGLTVNQQQLIALMAALRQFFRRNPYVTIARDPADPGKGSIRFEMEMEIGAVMRHTTTPNKSNVRSFTGAFVVRGVVLEEIAGFPDEDIDIKGGGTVETISIRLTKASG